LKLIECTYEGHAEQILAIFNEAIITSTALYDYKARTIENMANWFKAKESGAYPVIGMVDDAGTLLGFASYGSFRAWPAYKYSIEHSVYLHKDHRGKGLGKTLMLALIERAQAQQYHIMVGGIDAANATSIALHEKLGFTHSGTIKQAGFKFGRWLDLAFYQLMLPTPHKPTDD
jgi:L-amino acid N-acyltransferase